jgi:hypothetical protein
VTRAVPSAIVGTTLQATSCRKVLKKLARALEEFTIYIDNNASGIVNYGERHRCRERISLGFVESAINQLVAKRFVKKQQMR